VNIALVRDRGVRVNDRMSPLYRNWLVSQGMSRNTIEQRVKFAEHFERRWGTFDVPSHEVVEWLMGYTGWTRRTYLSHVKSLYAFLIETGVVTESPVAKMRTPPPPPPRPKPLNAEELRTVLESADDRMRAWLLLGYLAGLRCHEIAKVRGEDIDERSFYVLGKGGREAVLPTHGALWTLAQSYPRKGWWFPSPQAKHDHVSPSLVGQCIRHHFRACGIEGTGSVHRLRYSFGTELSRSGAQIRVVQTLLRHSSLETTQRYIAVDEAERRAAIGGLVA